MGHRRRSLRTDLGVEGCGTTPAFHAPMIESIRVISFTWRRSFAEQRAIVPTNAQAFCEPREAEKIPVAMLTFEE